jgi:hypothetical protein
VLTHFRFAVSSELKGFELARVNDYFIHSKSEATHLIGNIDDLPTHCSKIREHAVAISGSATATGFSKIFSLLGLNSPEKEKNLVRSLTCWLTKTSR